MRPTPRLLTLAITLLAATPALAQDSAGEVDGLLRRGEVEQAYVLAQQRAPRESGNPRFDQAFARAAIAARHPDEAVFALERVLALQPGNDTARLELARAELMLGNQDGARRALDTLLAHAPPEPLRSEALALRARTQPLFAPPRIRLVTDLRYGYDTNIGSASSVSGITAYTPEQVTALSTNVPTKDHYTQVDLALETEQAIATEGLLFGNVAASTRDNFHSDTFDARSFDFRAGGLWTGKTQSLRLTAQRQQYYLDNQTYRISRLLLPEWGIALAPTDRAFVFAQLGSLHYLTQAAQNVDLTLAGVAWVHTFLPTTQLAVSLYHGDEQAGADDATTRRAYFGRSYFGWRLRLQSTLAERHLLYIGAGNQNAEHDAIDPTFMLLRKDTLGTFEAGWHWRFAPAWQLKAGLNSYKNTSNIALYQYRRAQTELGMQYNFF